MSSSAALRTPETNKENVKSRVRATIQQSRVGRVPLSPSSRKTSGGPSAPSTVASKTTASDLGSDTTGLSIAGDGGRGRTAPGGRLFPEAVSTPAPAEESGAPQKRRFAANLAASASAPTRSRTPSSSSTSSSLNKVPSLTHSQSQSGSQPQAGRTRTPSLSSKPGGASHRTPIQMIANPAPDWDALAPQAQVGMLGLNQDIPMNLTGVVKDDWEGHTAVVSEETMRKARAMSRKKSHVDLPAKNPRAGASKSRSGSPVNDEDALVEGMKGVSLGGDAALNTRIMSEDGADDRYLGQRDAEGGHHIGHSLAPAALDAASSASAAVDPAHDARLRSALDLDPSTDRIVSFAAAAPKAREDPTMALQRELVKPIYARPGATGGSNGVFTNKTRKIPTVAERTLDAPGMINDYYLNLISWSVMNVVGVALRESVYIWNAETNETELLASCEQENDYVSSIDFAGDGSFAGVGVSNGDVEIYDVETRTRLRSMSGHQSQVSVLSWNNHIVSSGCADGSIWHHDVRVAQHKVMELLGHQGEVCGLKWRPDGELLASGANDNVVNCWDGRVGSVGTEGASETAQAKWSKSVHTAAVKAIAWAPWNNNLLASGGGTSDCRINIWSATTGSRLHSIETPAQVTSIHFSPHSKEIFSTHGFPTNALMIHAYPSLDKVAEIRDAHDARILNSCVSPSGDLVVTNSGDENIKFWRIWEVPVEKAKKKSGMRKENAGLGPIR